MAGKKIKFEESLKRLEEIVAKLDQGGDDLEAIVKLYQEGSQLIKKCTRELQSIENKIEVISNDSVEK